MYLSIVSERLKMAGFASDGWRVRTQTPRLRGPNTQADKLQSTTSRFYVPYQISAKVFSERTPLHSTPLHSAVLQQCSLIRGQNYRERLPALRYKVISMCGYVNSSIIITSPSAGKRDRFFIVDRRTSSFFKTGLRPLPKAAA